MSPPLRDLPRRREPPRQGRDSGCLSAVPRVPKKPGYKYENSNRYYRGRVLAELRKASEDGVTLCDLGSALRDGFSNNDLPLVESIVRSLQKDGLAVFDGCHP